MCQHLQPSLISKVATADMDSLSQLKTSPHRNNHRALQFVTHLKKQSSWFWRTTACHQRPPSPPKKYFYFERAIIKQDTFELQATLISSFLRFKITYLSLFCKEWYLGQPLNNFDKTWTHETLSPQCY